MTTPVRPRRPIATITRRQPVCPIPAAVFLEPVYPDGQPYRGPEDEDDVPSHAR